MTLNHGLLHPMQVNKISPFSSKRIIKGLLLKHSAKYITLSSGPRAPALGNCQLGFWSRPRTRSFNPCVEVPILYPSSSRLNIGQPSLDAWKASDFVCGRRTRNPSLPMRGGGGTMKICWQWRQECGPGDEEEESLALFEG